MQTYHDKFEQHGLLIGQVLLSHEDFSHRESFKYEINIRAALELGVVPIINENDTVSTEEIEFGDNDRLAVLLSNAIESECCVILSSAPGLIDFDKSEAPIPVIEKIDEKIYSLARGGNNMGRGGMGSKLIAIEALIQSGKNSYFADGRESLVC